jgi:hypothetical protein
MGPVVEELLSAGLAAFVVPSRQIRGLRTRYGSAGNKDDRFDACVLADTLRTGGRRWKPLRPGTGPARALRAACRSGKDLAGPGAGPGAAVRQPGTGLSRHDRPVHQALQRDQPGVLAALPDCCQGRLAVPQAAGQLAQPGGVYRRRQRWDPVWPAGRCGTGLTGAEGEARGQITLALVSVIGALNTQIAALDAEIGRLLAAHPGPAQLRQPPALRDDPRREPPGGDR